MENNFITKNFSLISYVVALIFFVGGAYAEFKYLEVEIEAVEYLVHEQEKDIDKLKESVKELELYKEHHEGYIEAKEK